VPAQDLALDRVVGVPDEAVLQRQRRRVSGRGEEAERDGRRADRAEHAVADILRWVWTPPLVPDWPRRRRVLEADILTRTSRLASHGWAGVFDTLSPHSSWLGDGRLQTNGYEFPDRDLSQARELAFVPVHSYTGADGLARLIGPNRARVLRLLDEPRSTTQLAALTGLPPGAVSGHLRVLLEAGAVLRRRAGRAVLYRRTSLGHALAAADR
jgi:DNA-binding transcriptional ArsR family regulator